MINYFKTRVIFVKKFFKFILFILFIVEEDPPVTQETLNANEDVENSVNHETGK